MGLTAFIFCLICVINSIAHALNSTYLKLDLVTDKNIAGRDTYHEGKEKKYLLIIPGFSGSVERKNIILSFVLISSQ